MAGVILKLTVTSKPETSNGTMVFRAQENVEADKISVYVPSVPDFKIEEGTRLVISGEKNKHTIQADFVALLA